MDESELEFLKALEGLLVIEEAPIEYRLYYNATTITSCSSQQHVDDGEYFIVDKDTYDNYFLYSVVNGELVQLGNNPGYNVQLKRGNTGYPVAKNNASIVIEQDEEYELN
jgi:hypothetical protein